MSALLGLGCSRLGSVLGADDAASERLVRHALASGVSFFDTSDLYGQGDSERMLGRLLTGQDDVTLCTKVGKRQPLMYRLLMPLKKPLAGLLKRHAAGAVGELRRATVPTDFRPAYLRKALDGSLRRLGRDRHDIVLLHSPSPEVLRAGDALGVLEERRAAGVIGRIGASVDDAAAAMAALDNPRCRVLQLPLHPGSTEFDAAIVRARANGVAIVARELFGGPAMMGQRKTPQRLAAILHEVATRPGIEVALVGTTSIAHLDDALAAFGSLPPTETPA